jgi:hypothetical protein
MAGLFRRAPVDDFAKALAREIANRYPPSIDREPAKRPSVNRLTRILEEACAKVVEFKSEYGLGWYGRAKLANAVRWELVELGYTKEFTDVATEAVVVHASGAAQQSDRAKTKA